MMPGGGVKWIAGAGFDEVISDLTAAGNLGLMLAIDGYRLGKDVKFYTYARKCVEREVWKQATFLRSVVRRKDGSSATLDLSIDPTKPDPGRHSRLRWPPRQSLGRTQRQKGRGRRLGAGKVTDTFTATA